MNKMWKLVVVIFVSIYKITAEQPVPLRGPPVVEKVPLLLSSFLPASMQIIAHLTDLMKYEILPVNGPTTTTAVPPTPSHKPAIYSPHNPPGPEAYYSRRNSYQEYVQRLQNPSGFNYFDRYRVGIGYPIEQFDQSVRRKLFRVSENEEVPEDDLDLLGKDLADLFKDANTIEENTLLDDTERAERFSKKYDGDFDFRNYIIGNKKVPPTRAYVSLLSLYDLLNKESKKLHLNKYGGYAQDVAFVLAKTSTGNAANQLHTVFSKLVERRDTKDQQIINKVKVMIADLEQTGSYINEALRYIPPLQFLL